MRNDYRKRTVVDGIADGNCETFFASGLHGKEVRSDGNGKCLMRGYYWKLRGVPSCVGPFSTRRYAEKHAKNMAYGRIAG